MPISQPPIGRARKPTANTAAVLSSWAVWFPAGKNDRAKYKANAEYTYQSYHSIKLPADPEKIDLRRRRRSLDAEGAVEWDWG
ncbi:hypothetical protein PTKU15_66660 [Paraburkholderia terrae]|nr:hypothetical protein PTKU15_66660 [Paraburkholderia terrae]